MNYRRFALLALASAFTLAYAQDDEQRRPPTEIPDFSNLDEYIYEPKSTVHLSFRMIGGPKTDFSGSGAVMAPEAALLDGANVEREYHDGKVGVDLRRTSRIDQGSNPFTPGSTGDDDVPDDGRTNNWNYTDPRQVSDAPLGYIAFHQYSANIDFSTQKGKSKSTAGLDLAVSRDMGKLFGDRFSWNLVAGMSINDISARRVAAVPGSTHTRRDLYSTFGQGVPVAPYTAPSSTTITYTDPQGLPAAISVDTSVLIGNQPALTREFDTPLTLTGPTNMVSNSWKLKGAYYTFRAGPQLEFPFTPRFRLSFSAGIALVYAGTNYTVTEVFTPPAGADIVEVDTEDLTKLLPGFYADANVEFDLTEKAGFFAGGVFQSAKSYTQSLNSTTSKYAAKVDLTNQTGLRAGMSIRF